MLTATSATPNRNPGRPRIASLRRAVVRVSSSGRESSYRLRRDRFSHGRQYAGGIGSTTGQPYGYLCLVRFRPTDPPVAVVADSPGCMSNCPLLVVVSAVRRSASRLQTGFDGVGVDTTSGDPVIVTSDIRFHGQFTDDADSSEPLRVLTVDDGRIVDVTRDYPVHVSRDANHQWRYFEEANSGPTTASFRGRGDLAAWAADECSLGRQTQAWSTLDDLAASGRLKIARGLGEPPAERYVEQVKHLLISAGYAD